MNKMIKIEFGFGTELDFNGEKISEVERADGLALIRRAAVETFGGCTLTKTRGDWKDPQTGYVYSEPGATLSVLVDRSKEEGAQIEETAKLIKQSLFQKAVYVTRYPVDAQLY